MNLSVLVWPLSSCSGFSVLMSFVQAMDASARWIWPFHVAVTLVLASPHSIARKYYCLQIPIRWVVGGSCQTTMLMRWFVVASVVSPIRSCVGAFGVDVGLGHHVLSSPLLNSFMLQPTHPKVGLFSH